jgi:hypothetical protein
VRTAVREACLRIIALGNVYSLTLLFSLCRVRADDFLRELRWLSTEPAPVVWDQPTLTPRNAYCEKFSETDAVEHD